LRWGKSRSGGGGLVSTAARLGGGERLSERFRFLLCR